MTRESFARNLNDAHALLDEAVCALDHDSDFAKLCRARLLTAMIHVEYARVHYIPVLFPEEKGGAS